MTWNESYERQYPLMAAENDKSGGGGGVDQPTPPLDDDNESAEVKPEPTKPAHESHKPAH